MVEESPLTPEQRRLIETSIPMALREANRYIRENTCDADEVLSDSYFSLIRSVQNFDGEKSNNFDCYAMMRVRFALREISRKRRQETLDSDVADQSQTVADSVVTGDAINRIRDTVTKEEFQLLYNRYILDIPTREIADRTGVPFNTVRQRLLRLITRLRNDTKLCHDLGD
jgi:RNA polymerase sigma factor (sigma-70 family)